MKIYNKQFFVIGLLFMVMNLFGLVVILLTGDSTQRIEYKIVIFLYGVMFVSKSFMKASSYPEIKKETDERERHVWFQSTSKTLDIVEFVGTMISGVTLIVYVVTKQRGWLLVCVVLSGYGALVELIRLATYRYYKRYEEQESNHK